MNKVLLPSCLCFEVILIHLSTKKSIASYQHQESFIMCLYCLYLRVYIRLWIMV